MSLVKAEQMTFHYETQAENLLDSISFEINESDRIGLIGANGCGKTTLFKLLKNEIQIKKGSLIIRNGLKIGYLPQEIRIEEEFSVYDYLWSSKPELFELQKKMKRIEHYEQDDIVNLYAEFENRNGYVFELRFEKTLSEFGFDSEFLNRKVATLSGGEKTKIGLCRLLLAESDILLLDEPTNHLDYQTLDWLENFLHSLDLPFIVISHDRTFLDFCVNKIWELKNSKLSIFTGNFSKYKEEKEIIQNRKLKAYENSAQKIAKLQQAVQVKRNESEKREHFKTKRSIKRNGSICKRDDGSSHAIRKEQSIMKRATTMQRKVEQELKEIQKNKPWMEKERRISFVEKELNVKHVLNVENLTKSFGGNKLFDNFQLTLSSNDKLAICGKNGSGKTTLLKILNGEIKDYHGIVKWNPQTKIGYYSQEFENLDFNQSIIDEVIAGDETLQTYARTVLGSLNIRREKVYDTIKTLSLGEKSKVLLAKLIVSGCNALLLDEPTNHLEISAREAMENALKQFPEAIIFVTHDRYLKKALMTREIILASA
jgi:ATP-binding cassette subfamily F protein 3